MTAHHGSRLRVRIALIALVPLGLTALVAAGSGSAHIERTASAPSPSERTVEVRVAAQEAGPPTPVGLTGSALRPLRGYHEAPPPPPRFVAASPTESAQVPGRNPAALVGDVIHLPAGPLGIPGIMMQAYQHAADLMARVQPGCHLPWTLLAGIGKIESGHAGGGQADSSGNTAYRILGPVLDGHLAGNAVITDTDGGAIDGDPHFDRAVGPMQFMPGTWAHFGADGNNDGISDPNNIYDATFAAGRLLCASGADLSSPANTTGAILTYNHSMPYVKNVQAWAHGYATGAYPTPAQLPPIGPDDKAIDADPDIDPAPTPDDLPDPLDVPSAAEAEDAGIRQEELIPGTGLTTTTIEIPGLPGVRVPCFINCPPPEEQTPPSGADPAAPSGDVDPPADGGDADDAVGEVDAAHRDEHPSTPSQEQTDDPEPPPAQGLQLPGLPELPPIPGLADLLPNVGY